MDPSNYHKDCLDKPELADSVLKRNLSYLSHDKLLEFYVGNAMEAGYFGGKAKDIRLNRVKIAGAVILERMESAGVGGGMQYR